MISFNPPLLNLPPSSQQTIKVLLKASQPERIRELIEVLVQNGDSLIIELFAEVQPTILSLNRVFLEFPTLFAGNTYESSSFAKASLKLQNLGNIPTKFRWLGRLRDWKPEDQEQVGDFITKKEKEEELEFWFEPKEGIIGGKEEMNVKFFLKPLKGGRLEEVFICECDGMEYPIGFEINVQV